MTLDDLAETVGKPAPYLSLLENGKKEPKIGLLVNIADAIDVNLGQLLEAEPPTERDRLEIELMRAQQTPLFAELDLPTIRPSSKLDDRVLNHIVGLHSALRESSTMERAGSEQVRRANGAVHRYLEDNDGYLRHVEEMAAQALAASGYAGSGPFTSRNLLDLTKHAGFDLRPIGDMPPHARSIVDRSTGRIYIAQRNELRTRQARKAVLQTIAGFLLDHEAEPDTATFMRQRVETAYFAAAVLAPEPSVLEFLNSAKHDRDINVEDIKEFFYLSYEMAAWRLANLVTRHLGIASHVLVTDDRGMIVKGYSNSLVPLPRDDFGGIETQRVCREFGARRILNSPDQFVTHHQYTDTPGGTFFCVTHLEAGREPAHAITFGVGFDDAQWFRGRETETRFESRCPSPGCCRSHGKLGDREVLVSARAQDRILGLLALEPRPDMDLADVLRILESQDEGRPIQ